MGPFLPKSKAIALVYCPILIKNFFTDFDFRSKSANIEPIFAKK